MIATAYQPEVSSKRTSFLGRLLWLAKSPFGAFVALTMAIAFVITCRAYYQNEIIEQGFLVGVVIWVLWVLVGVIGIRMLFFLIDVVFLGKDGVESWNTRFAEEDDSRERGHFPPLWDLMIIFSPLWIVTIVSCFIFATPVSGKTWVIGERSTGYDGWVAAIPFVQPIKGIKLNQTVTYKVSGITKDGVQVLATVSGEFALHPDYQVVLNFARRYESPDEAIRSFLGDSFNEGFVTYVATKTRSELTDLLGLEAGTIQGLNNDALRKFGVVWDGPFKISDLHPTFALDRFL